MTAATARALLATTGGAVALVALGSSLLDPGAGHFLLTAAALAFLGVLGGAFPNLLRPARTHLGRVLLAGTVSAAVLGSGTLLVLALAYDDQPTAAAGVALTYVAAAAMLRALLLDGPRRVAPRTVRRRTWSVERTPPPLTAIMEPVHLQVLYGHPVEGHTYTRVSGVA